MKPTARNARKLTAEDRGRLYALKGFVPGEEAVWKSPEGRTACTIIKLTPQNKVRIRVDAPLGTWPSSFHLVCPSALDVPDPAPRG